MAGRWRLICAAAMVVPLTAAAGACSGCELRSCMQPGVYLDLSAQPAADSAEICINTDCTTLAVETIETAESATGPAEVDRFVNNPRTLTEGSKVDVVITIRDANQRVLTRLVEQRKVARAVNECTCPVFAYRWKGDGLRRG